MGEILGIRLLTLHNLHFFLNLAAQIRQAIEEGRFSELRARYSEDFAKSAN